MLNIETRNAYVVEVELPGVTPQELKVDLRGRELLVSGVSANGRKTRSIRNGKRRGGEIHYFVTFSESVNAAAANAPWREDYLTVRVPRGASEGPNWVSLQIEHA